MTGAGQLQSTECSSKKKKPVVYGNCYRGAVGGHYEFYVCVCLEVNMSAFSPHISLSLSLSLSVSVSVSRPGVMGEYEPKIEVHFASSVLAAKGLTVRLECFALGK